MLITEPRLKVAEGLGEYLSYIGLFVFDHSLKVVNLVELFCELSEPQVLGVDVIQAEFLLLANNPLEGRCRSIRVVWIQIGATHIGGLLVAGHSFQSACEHPAD